MGFAQCFTEPQRGDQAEADGFAVGERAIARLCFQRVADGVAQIEHGAQPDSRWSKLTMRALTRIERAHDFAVRSASRATTRSALSSSRVNSAGSPISAVLTTSAKPLMKPRADSVLR